MKRLFYTLLAVAALPVFAAEDRTPKVRAYVTPDSVRLGDCFEYVIEVERDLAQVTSFPVFAKRADEGRPAGEADVELVEELPVDTLAREGRMLHLRKRYRLQIFDEGRVNMGRGQVLYADKNIVDTLYGDDTLYLTVAMMQIDTAAQGPLDLKGQKGMPFRMGEVSGYLLWGLVGLLLLAGLLYGVKRLLARYGKGFGDIFKPAPPLPPHVVAIRALEALHHRKLWQNGKFKTYYSELTDILRTYIAGRYGIGAMEMTSDEILASVRTLAEEELPKKAAMDLTAILRDADLVKFAKAEPDAEQNENDYTKAYYFVEETKQQEAEPSEGEGIENS